MSEEIEEEIELLENKISEFRFMQNTLDENEKESYANDIQESEIQAIEYLIQEYKEDEEVIKLLIKDIEEEQNCVQNPTKCSKSCYVCIEEEYRNKVKEKKVIE